MKKLYFLVLLITTSVVYSQNPGFTTLRKINGITIDYKISNVKSTEKFDTWLIDIEYTNTSGSNLYYTSKTVEKTDLVGGLLGGDASKKETKNYFAEINLENVRSFDFTSDDGCYAQGDKTRLKTDQGDTIFCVKKGKTYTNSFTFKGKKGVQPVISVQVVNSIVFTDNLLEFL